MIKLGGAKQKQYLHGITFNMAYSTYYSVILTVYRPKIIEEI